MQEIFLRLVAKLHYVTVILHLIEIAVLILILVPENPNSVHNLVCQHSLFE